MTMSKIRAEEKVQIGGESNKNEEEKATGRLVHWFPFDISQFFPFYVVSVPGKKTGSASE